MKLKKIFTIIIATLFLISFAKFSYATDIGPGGRISDVGSFESYDSGGSSGGSSFSGGSSYSGSSYSGSSYRSGSSSSSSDGGSMLGFIIFAIIIIAIIIASKRNGNNNSNAPTPPTNYNTGNSALIEQKVKAVDPLFNREEFMSWTRTLFIKLQEAWTARDWETIRTFESVELFEQHKKQLQGYIDNHQINVMERIAVLSVELSEFSQTGDKDILTCVLKSRMNDYIIDDRTKQLLKGDKSRNIYGVYKMVFVRKTGVVTKGATGEVNKMNCPNCGAPTAITSSGKCQYCGSVITTGEHDWVLNDLTRIG